MNCSLTTEAWYRANEAVDTVKHNVELVITLTREYLSNARKMFLNLL